MRTNLDKTLRVDPLDGAKVRGGRWPALLCVTVGALAAANTAHAQTFVREHVGASLTERYGNPASIGDVNGDGHDDLAVGAKWDSTNTARAGRVSVYSGADGALLYEIFGTRPDGEFGRSIADAGDINGDGFADFMVAAHQDNLEFFLGGSVSLYSGVDGALLRRYAGPDESAYFGQSIANAGDIDGDGVDDAIIGLRSNSLWDSGTAHIYSGATGALLYSLEGTTPGGSYARVVAGAGDVNGDGRDDFIVGDPESSFASGPSIPPLPPGPREGEIYVYSGLDGSLLHFFEAPPNSNRFATIIRAAGDVNGDGFADLIAGDRNAEYPMGAVSVYSGFDGSVLHYLVGVVPFGDFGAAVDAMGDVDGDGKDDFIIASPGDSRGGSRAGSVQVFSGATGSSLYTVHGPTTNGYFGSHLAGGGDFDADGVPDFALQVYIGLNFSEGDFALGSTFVCSGSAVPEILYDSLCNGDGGNQAGCTNCPCLNNAPPGTTGGCLNSALTSAALEASGDPSVSTPFSGELDLRFALTGAPPTATCLLLSGNAVAPGGMANPCFGLGTGVQATIYDGLRCATSGVRRMGVRAADSDGQVGTTNSPWGGESGPAAGLAAFAGSAVAGDTRYFQVVFRDDPLLSCGRGLNTSQAIRVVFTP